MSSIVQLFDFLAFDIFFDIFLTSWHLFDILTQTYSLNYVSPSQGYFFFLILCLCTKKMYLRWVRIKSITLVLLLGQSQTSCPVNVNYPRFIRSRTFSLVQIWTHISSIIIVTLWLLFYRNIRFCFWPIGNFSNNYQKNVNFSIPEDNVEFPWYETLIIRTQLKYVPLLDYYFLYFQLENVWNRLWKGTVFNWMTFALFCSINEYVQKSCGRK